MVWFFAGLSNLGNGEGATLARVESKRPGMIQKIWGRADVERREWAVETESCCEIRTGPMGVGCISVEAIRCSCGWKRRSRVNLV